MKKMKLIVTAIMIITFGITSTGLARSDTRSLGKRASSDKNWRPVWQVDRKISGYKIKIHSGKPIVNTVQLLDSERKKEFTYARYFGSGAVITKQFDKPIKVGRIKVNMDKARGSKIELWVYTEKEKTNRVEKDKRDRNNRVEDEHRDRNRRVGRRGDRNRYPDDYEHGERRRRIGRHPRYDDRVERRDGRGPYSDDTHRPYPPDGHDPRIDRLRNSVSLGNITPALRDQTIIWYVGGQIRGFNLVVEQGRANIESIRLISGDRILREREVRRYVTSGEALREDIGPTDITRIEIDVFENENGSFSLSVRE